MAKKLLTLAKELDFQTEVDYYEYLIQSHINGQKSQCERLFNKMSKKDKKDFLSYLRDSYANFYDIETAYKFYFNLL